MSGEVSRAKQRKTRTSAKAAKENGENGVNASDVFENGKTSKSTSTGASITGYAVRLVFYSLLSIFVVVATLVSIDYKTGLIKETYNTHSPLIKDTYNTHVPPEIRQRLDEGMLVAGEAFDSAYAYYDTQMKEGKILARRWVKGVEVGGINLEQVLFEEEIEKEKLDVVRQAAEKIKLAVDAAEKLKIQEEAEKLRKQKIIEEEQREKKRKKS